MIAWRMFIKYKGSREREFSKNFKKEKKNY